MIYLVEFPLARFWKNAFDPQPDASLFTFERFPPKTPAFLCALVAISVFYVEAVQQRLFPPRARPKTKGA